MSKSKTPRSLKANEAQAITRSIRVSPSKLNLVAGTIRGKKVDINSLVVAQAFVGKNLVMRRFATHGRGKVGSVEKYFSQLTIVVRAVEEAA